MKPSINTIWLLLILVLSLVGCGSDADTAEITIEDTPVTLELVTFETGGAWGTAQEAVIEKFRETYPQVTIERASYGRWPQAYLESETPPDLMTMTHSRFLDEAISKNQLVDVTDLWVRSGLMESYLPNVRVLSEVDGKQYYLPIGYSWVAIYYNKAIFERYNLESPNTWDEFIAICDTLLANGEVPLSLSGDDTWTAMLWFSYLNLRLNGPTFHHQVIDGSIPFNDARLYDVVSAWGSLVERDYFVERPMGLGELESLTAIIRSDGGQLHNQKAVMVLSFSSNIDDLPLKFQTELDFFRFPIIDSSIPLAEVLGAFGYMIPARSAQVPQTMAFLSYLGSAEAQTILVQHTRDAVSYIPAHNDVDNNLLAPSVQRGRGLLQDTDSFVPAFMISAPRFFWSKGEIAIRQLFDSPTEVEVFLDRLEDARQQSIEEELYLQ